MQSVDVGRLRTVTGCARLDPVKNEDTRKGQKYSQLEIKQMNTDKIGYNIW
jgi:hypothetical protein